MGIVGNMSTIQTEKASLPRSHNPVTFLKFRKEKKFAIMYGVARLLR